MATAEELYDEGIDLFSEGRYDEAIRAYEKAIELDPGFVDALHGLALALAENGDVRAAIVVARRIIAASPDDPLGYTSLSMLLQKDGKIADAEAAAAEARVREWKQTLKNG
jgi:tetratricopeptide (TPR) repeat protein